MKAPIERLQALGPAISRIVSTSGSAGAAVGVLHYGEVIYTDGFGYRDIERKIPMDDETLVSLFSLTKAMTAAAVGVLVDKKQVSWDSTVASVLPDFQHQSSTIQKETTVRDLLTHRAGLGQYNALWMQDFGKFYLGKDQTLVTASTLPTIAGFREKFQYNNWNYGLLGFVVKALSGLSLGRYLETHFFQPLGMNRTTVVRSETGNNISEGYISLANGFPLRTERPFAGDDQIMFGAQGVNSCVKDLLVFYDAMLKAAEVENETGPTETPLSPFRQVRTIFSSQIPTSTESLLERSYGFGWFRSQLPNTMASSGMNRQYVSEMPTLARGSKSQLALYHGGNSAASQTWVILLPETHSAIVVLTNTMANCDASNWIASMILEALLDSPEKTDFEAIAEEAAKRGVELWHELHQKIAKQRVPGTKAKPLTEYAGKYWNQVGNWYMDVFVEDGVLNIAFQGDRKHAHTIRHHYNDIFTWLMTQDENAAIGRFPYTSPGQWLLNFQGEGDRIEGLKWNQNGIKDGEYFHKGEYCTPLTSTL